MAAVAEAGGDGPALRIVDPEDAHGRIDGYAGILSQHVPAVGTRLPAVDSDMGFTPPRPDSSRLQRPIGFNARLHQPLDELFLVGPLKPHLPRRVGQEIGKCRTAVGMVEIDQDMGRRRPTASPIRRRISRATGRKMTQMSIPTMTTLLA